MIDDAQLRRFERLALPHLDAAYNLARWLTRNDDDARDVVQEATLRGMRYFAAFRGDNARPWLLQVVRHACFDWMRANRPAEAASFGHVDDILREIAGPAADEPLAVALRVEERARVNAALAALPVAYREVLVLREMEDLPYNDIARIIDAPVGTVMSRLSRARGQMRSLLAAERPALRAVPGPAAKVQP